MITLWRVDAIHELGGELTHFYEHAEAAEASAEQLRCWGWYADAYTIQIDPIPPAAFHELMTRPHPNADTPALLILAWLDTLDAEDPQRLLAHRDLAGIFASVAQQSETLEAANS